MADVTDSVTATPPPPPPQPPLPLPLPPPPSSSRPLPVREDCWTEEASATLIDEWGRRYVDLNRGNLRQKDWQEVADAVNALHAHSKKTHRTDVQCKNRLDTIKKKYKVEKSRVLSSNGAYVSNWVFFDKLDFLIGGGGVTKPSPETPKLSASPASPPVGLPLPFGRTPSPATAKVVALPQKRSAASVALALPEVVSGVGADEGFSFSRRNYSKMAAAAAAAEAEDEGVEESGEGDEGDGIRRLARAIEGFVRVYERVEGEKLKHMMEMEKQRMQFEKDLELQRMQMFMDTQLQLERIKRGKPSGSDGELKS